jgi:hypothetical protein
VVSRQTDQHDGDSETMSKKMKPLPHDIALHELFTHQSRAYRQLSRIFHSGARATSKDLGMLMNMSMGSILMALKVFREHNLIYVCGWEQGGGTNLLAVYRAGNFKDVAKPPPLPVTQRRAESKKLKEMAEQTKQEDAGIYQELASALVPRRTEEEQHDVNWMYLNWISER